MKKLLTLITLLFGLVACTSQTELDVKSEKLHSFLIVENKLYVVGELHDYEFENKLVKELNHFLQSPFANKIQDIAIYFMIKSSPNIEGSYQVMLAPKDFSDTETTRLKSDFGFELRENQLVKTYQADGKLVKLTNRTEILQKFRFKQPLDATLTYYNTTLTEHPATSAFAPILLPIGVILYIPFAMIGCAMGPCI